MKGTSPRQMAVYISLLTTLAAGIVISLEIIFRESFPLWILPVLLGALFYLIYLAVYYILSEFIYEKINPIYKTIHNFDLGRRDFRKAMEIRDEISAVENDVSVWALGKSQEIDQLKQLEKYRREFLGNVSHELKTPIFNIQGYILTLLDGGLEDPSINRQYLERTEKSINRLISIVEDLESISGLEAGELKLTLENFNIVNLVEDVYEMQEMLARRYGLKLQFEKGHDKNIRVYADRKRIIEAINNLIINAIKYSKPGGTITVSFVDIGDQILIEITDTGIGISEKDLPRIFERFYRVDKSRSRDQGGTGLGLAIVKHIIEAHEQTIRVRSKAGEGSTFSLTLEKTKIKKDVKNAN
jgi:two-component system phosphate regulon sensor histidine kinase PhoR